MDRFVTKTRKKTLESPDEEKKKIVEVACQSGQVKRRRLESNFKDEASLSATEEEDKDFAHALTWKKIEAEGLDCDYTLLFQRSEADIVLKELEKEVEYFSGDLAKVHVFGKLHNIPRRQATYGDQGLKYTFSGLQLSARPWTPTLVMIRDRVTEATGHSFNFVLINRYQDGNDHIGEHRDDERELDSASPIASVSFGASREFVFRHCSSRGKKASRKIEPVCIELQHGSLLLMNWPTNVYWYHSLPVRKKVLLPRVNLTFRKIVGLNKTQKTS
ncbi:DNA oxidative demethylase ALKBH2 [Erpetoichthys calabaricus]|uniref:DNA oxidative demethylase ALKBH2 n=1 Tax=Erpetoichthys calabaricus TaxID=27687 RepID=A0A8C4T4V9_ERPCA|nr:DNA oxidative demethylase ALKBH2 [Erpetoichthys calabaricus]